MWLELKPIQHWCPWRKTLPTVGFNVPACSWFQCGTGVSTVLHVVSPWQVLLHAMLQGEHSFCMRCLFASVGTLRRTGDATPEATTMVTCFADLCASGIWAIGPQACHTWFRLGFHYMRFAFVFACGFCLLWWVPVGGTLRRTGDAAPEASGHHNGNMLR